MRRRCEDRRAVLRPPISRPCRNSSGPGTFEPIAVFAVRICSGEFVRTDQLLKQLPAVGRSCLSKIKVGQSHLVREDISPGADACIEFLPRSWCGPFDREQKPDQIQRSFRVRRASRRQASQFALGIVKTALFNIKVYQKLAKAGLLRI